MFSWKLNGAYHHETKGKAWKKEREPVFMFSQFENAPVIFEYMCIQKSRTEMHFLLIIYSLFHLLDYPYSCDTVW